jgi:hypothetical protein
MEPLQTIENLHNPIFQATKGVEGQLDSRSTVGETPTFSNNNSQPVPVTDLSSEVGIKEEPDIECMIPVDVKDDSESELPLVSEASDEVDEIVNYDTCFGVVSHSATPQLRSIPPSSYLAS